MGNPPFFAELSERTRRSSDRTNLRRARRVSRLRLGCPANGGHAEQLLSRLQQRIMAELGFAEPIDPDRPLNEVGLDSLRSVTLANNLEDEFGILISISELISGPTINQLVGTLIQSVCRTRKERGCVSGLGANYPEWERPSPEQGAVQYANDHAPDEERHIELKIETTRWIIRMPEQSKRYRTTAG